MEIEILRRPVVGPSAWKRADYSGRADWVWPLDDRERGELDKLLRAAAPKAADFPSLARLLGRTWRELKDGRGFVVLRGFPVDDYSVPEIERLYLALGSLMGTPVSQNSYGDILGHVRDEGKRYRTTGDIRGARGYLSNEALLFHADLSDVVGLLALSKALEGGLSSITSSMSIYNEVLARHPEYLPVYYRGFPYLNNEAGGDQAELRIPVYTYHQGMLSFAIRRNMIETARLNGVHFSDLELAALQFFDDTAARPDLRFDMQLEPGDIQWLNNYITVHSRTRYTDDPARPRHLLRLWLQLPDGRAFLKRYPTVYDGIPKTLNRQ
ncbi:MAG: TauD/TfdA family dioxygenase [Alphaproteobacteria bacterium]|nr:TauD/TfdA family dioxygenase [Alphaproteobacteria bacterium]